MDSLEECKREMIYLVATFVRPNKSQTIDGIGVDLLHSLELRSKRLTTLLEKPLEEVGILPADEQDAIASQILDSMVDEVAWKTRYGLNARTGPQISAF